MAVSGLLILCFLVNPGQAQSLFSYKDKNGTVHITRPPAKQKFNPRKLFKRKKSLQKKLAKIKKHIISASRKYKLDPALVAAVIRAESDFNPVAVSRVGAKGLMQLMPDTAADLKVKDTFDPVENIFGGVRYLRQMLDRFDGSLDLALAAYNIGPEKVKAAGSIPEVKETVFFVSRVKKYFDDFKPWFEKNNAVSPTRLFKWYDEEGRINITDRPPKPRPVKNK